MTLDEFLNNKIGECKKEADILESAYHRGLITADGVRKEKLWEIGEAWKETISFCKAEGIDLEGRERDDAYQTLHKSIGITIKKVPVRYYPTVEMMTGSLYYIYGIRNAEVLFYEDSVIGRTFIFQISMKLGEEKIPVEYCFKIEREICELEKKGASWEGWRCFEGHGKVEGYNWADASIHVREHEGKLQSVAIQKTYLRETAPIWKMHSPDPVIGTRWIGFYEEIRQNLEIEEGEFYDDETMAPPRGRNYRQQGILAYDDTDEIVILGIRDEKAEVVVIPDEIDGKPVTVIDKSCFANCSKTLKKVILPDTLKEIGDYAFEQCEKLEKPVIPPSVTKVGRDLFGKLY